MDGADCMGGAKLNINVRYWRKNNESEVVLNCYNNPAACAGGSHNTSFYCGTGYYGPMCESCDVEGKVWGKTYARAGEYECKECTGRVLI